MADPRGFLRVRDRDLPATRPVEVRIRDWDEVRPLLAGDRARLATLETQAGRCMDCGVPFCHMGCPLGNVVPEWNDLVWRGQWEDAVERLHATNNFPEFTGRLCPAPCEAACVLGISQPAVTIKNVEAHLAEEAFARGLVTPHPPERLTGQTVAVVGSGPAGLAAAQQLTRAGHTVAVFERDDAIGGLLRYGIPEFKMAGSVIDRRLEQMRAEGTRFYPGVRVGVGVTGPELRAGYDAVVLAIGAGTPRDLPVPGRDLGGVLQAMDYLVPANRAALGRPAPGQVVAEGKDVVVVGGGDTGADCVGTAVRQGARSVTQLEILPCPPTERPAHQPWPLYPTVLRTSTSHEEGCGRVFATGTQELLGDDGGQVRAVRVADVVADDGAFAPVAGTVRDLPAQLVVLALGFAGPERGPLTEQLDLGFGARGALARNQDFSTGVDGVFVAGDAGRGQSLVVWAIAEGRAVAAAVDAYLTGGTELPAPVCADSVALGV